MNYAPIKLFAATAFTGLLLAGCGGNSGSPNNAAQPPAQTGLPGDGATGNSPPSISGTAPQQATVGREWSFQPSIFDPDGDQLTATAINLPPWVYLDKNSGRLRGTPTNADVQIWGKIVLTISDGSSTASLPAFAINVMPENVANGSATLSWMPPTERVDGSPIGQLSGYRLLYGQASGSYTHVIEINNPGITRYMIEGLTSGDWYFAIQAVDAGGLISTPSAEARKTV